MSNGLISRTAIAFPWTCPNGRSPEPSPDVRRVLPYIPWRRCCARIAAFLLGCAVGLAPLAAQDVEDLLSATQTRLEEKPVRVTGGLHLNSTLASYSGPQPRYDKYGLQIGANVNFDILGVQAPFSIYFSDKNLLYRLPSYQFVGISPSYRWARVHLGDRNLNFSPYTFSDQTFRGVGVELTPGRWRFAGMAGRLRYQSLFDVGARSGLEETYRRNGYAAEAGYQGDKFSLKAIVFAAKDDLPDVPLSAAIGVAPASNVVTSFGGSYQLPLDLRLEAEYTRSWLTVDLEAPTIPDSLALRSVGRRAASWAPPPPTSSPPSSRTRSGASATSAWHRATDRSGRSSCRTIATTTPPALRTASARRTPRPRANPGP